MSLKEVFSRKVFVGGLPFDITENDLQKTFNRYGKFNIEWDSRSSDKKYRGGNRLIRKGYAFLIFDKEISVQRLMNEEVFREGLHYYLNISTAESHKKVQIRPWRLDDCCYIENPSEQLNPRYTIFLGALPRHIRADMLANLLKERFGPVCYAGIDTDPTLNYPQGAARITFRMYNSYVNAIKNRYITIPNDGCTKRLEIKPYILDDQQCDNCHGKFCARIPATLFCPDIECLQYYCEICWALMHRSTNENPILRTLHKPFDKRLNV
uniref:Cytoplasmic polyadenylation element-binding protein 1 n=1 Tax=Meloidogyne hapla TaxID=6305 RepID=A0A1I8B4D0_MELHA